MPVTVVCPSCSARIKAPDTAIGKTVKCPKCASTMMIGAPEPAPEVVEIPPTQDEAPPQEDRGERRRARSRRDEDERPRPRKKSNKGLIIGLSIGGVVLVSLCC